MEGETKNPQVLVSTRLESKQGGDLGHEAAQGGGCRMGTSVRASSVVVMQSSGSQVQCQHSPLKLPFFGWYSYSENGGSRVPFQQNFFEIFQVRLLLVNVN